MDTVTVIGVPFGLLVIVGIYIWLRISMVRYQAIRDRKKDVVMFWGLVRLILWEPNEGLVLLRYKRIADVIQGAGGGIKFIFPARGEELRARVPLTLRLVTWEDSAILTRESIQVKMKVAVWWRVTDLPRYVFSIDTGVHIDESHREVGLLEAAELWLKTLTESTLRTLASQASVALLISSKATSYLHVESAATKGNGHDGVPALGSPESLAAELGRELARKASDYGLEIQRVEIQELALSREIQESIDRVWKASLLPAQTEQEARAHQIELEATAKVLGVDTVALNEIMKNFQGSSFFALPAFLESLLAKVAQKTDQTRSLLPGGSPPALSAGDDRPNRGPGSDA